MRHHLIELTDDHTGHGVLVHLEHITRVTEEAERKSRIYFEGTGDSIVVRETLGEIIDKLPRQVE